MTDQPSLTRSVSLEPGTIHIWIEQLDIHLQKKDLSLVLSSDELTRSTSYRFERDRSRFITSRALLRNILSEYTGIPAEKLQFQYNAHGKPALSRCAKRIPIQFNVSHSEGIAVFALSYSEEIGIDIELYRELEESKMEQIADLCFSRRQLDQLKSFAPHLKAEFFFRTWTIIEASLKLKGDRLGQSKLNSDDSTHFGPFIRTFTHHFPFIISLACRISPLRIVEYKKNTLPQRANASLQLKQNASVIHF